MRQIIFALVFGFATSTVLSVAQATNIQERVSPAGIAFWLVEDDTVPIIALNFAMPGGSSHDPDGKGGVSNLMSGLLDEGAGDLDSQAFQTALDEKSIKISFDAARDNFYGQMRTLKANQDAAFDLLALAVQSPRFDEAPLERVKAQVLSGIRQAQTDPNSIVSRNWYKAAFGDHPYGRPSNGTEESVSALTGDDLRNFHGRIFAREHLKIAIVGSIDAATAGVMIDKVFADLPEKADLSPIADITPNIEQMVGEKLDVPQTVIRFGGMGIARDDPDFIAAYVLNYILGGGAFSSRLYTEIREERGLAYSVYSYFNPLKHTALFQGGVATRQESADESLQLIRDEIARLGKDGPTAKELEEAKKYLKGSYALRFDTSSKIARILLGLQVEGISADYIDERNGLIDAVTLDDLKRISKTLFGDANLLISRVGPNAEGGVE